MAENAARMAKLQRIDMLYPPSFGEPGYSELDEERYLDEMIGA